MRARSFLLMMLTLVVGAISACDDEVTDPDGLIQSAEAEAVARSASALPSLTTIIDSIAPDDDRGRATLFRARELWDAGTAIDNPRSGARRRLAVRYALPVLIEEVPVEEWVSVRKRVDDWVATATSMLRHLSMPPVQSRLEVAGEYLRRSDHALEERDRIYYLLLASAELMETTPRFVARIMARDAERAMLAAADRTPPLSRRSYERAERLKEWAAMAVEEGEYLLAIQRAYYAMQLLGEP